MAIITLSAHICTYVWRKQCAMHKLFCVIIRNLIKTHCNVLRQRDKVPKVEPFELPSHSQYRQHIVSFLIGTEAVLRWLQRKTYNFTATARNGKDSIISFIAPDYCVLFAYSGIRVDCSRDFIVQTNEMAYKRKTKKYGKVIYGKFIEQYES